VAGYPLDAIRIRMIFHTSTANMFNGFTFSFLYSIGKNGLVWPIQRTLQDNAKERFGENGVASTIVTGAIGNVIPGFIFNPCNVIKVRLMESGTKKPLVEVVRHMYQNEGFAAFTKGVGATLARDAVWGSLYFPVYTHLKGVFPSNSESDLFYTTTSSALAAGTATMVSSFLDGARLFEQHTADAGKKSLTFMEGFKRATQINRWNALATASGVIRVTFTTVLGHITFLQVIKLLEGDRTMRDP